MATASVVCGYCLVKDEQMVDPRSLPCHHVHCYACLVGDFEATRIVRCGTCKAVSDVTLARLPPVMKREDNLQICDTCSDNKTQELAVSYCTDCSKKMCSKHLESHHQIYPLHKDLLDIKDCQKKAKGMVERYCATHQDKAITMGCLTCFQVLCPTCVDCTKECAYGSAHYPITLKKLVKLLKDKRDEIKVKAWAKEGELATLLKRSTKVLTDYEKKTKELVDQLHESRDKQLSELRRKYDELEKELVDNRRTSKEQLVEFIERDIVVKITEMNTLLLLLDAKFKESHQVDLIKSFTETYNEIRRFIDEDLPSLTLTNQKSLGAQDTTEELELKIVDGAAISVFLLTPPTSLKLKKEVPVSSAYYTVAHTNEFTYAAGDGPTLYRIDESANSVTLLTLPKISCIDGLCLYNGRLYTVAYPYKVLVTDLNGNLITSWSLPESASDYVNKLVVTGDKVIVPDSSNKCLTVYSLYGRVFRHISCPQKGEWSKMALCAPDHKSVVVSSNTTSTVFRVNIATGETMWTCTAVDNPGGVACYKGEYILVTPLNSKRTEIHMLQADTGRYLGKLTDPNPRTSSQVTDLCVSGDNLIIPRPTEKTVLHYELSHIQPNPHSWLKSVKSVNSR